MTQGGQYHCRSTSLSDWAQTLREISENHRRLVEGLMPGLQRITEAKRDIDLSLGRVVRELAERFREMPDQNRHSTRILAQHGWYIDPELSPSDYTEAAGWFASGEAARAHDALCDHYDAEASRMLSNLAKQLPARERLLQSAFRAHERGEYACSVPLLLIQADGVCHDFCGEQLYGRRDGVPRLAKVLDGFAEGFFLSSLLAPLVEATPLSAGPQERAELPPDILNRHVILHGESTDYDTRRNSCRAISLLVYVAWVLEDRPTPPTRGGEAAAPPRLR